MKVLLISPSPPPIGGISRWTQVVLSFLKKENECEMVHINSAPKYRGKTTFIKRFIWGTSTMVAIINMAIREFKKGIDVVHITSSGSLALFREWALLRIAKRYGVSTVLHLHFGRIPEVFQTRSWEWRLLVKAFSYCDVIIAIDKKTERVLGFNGYAAKTFYCPNPIDVDRLNILNTNQTRVKKVVFVGHIYPEKGVRELVDAWRAILIDFPDYYLELIGSVVETDFIDSLPKDDSICFIGEKSYEDTMKMLSEATVLVLPSYTEGFPNVVLEAMALKVPVIATNVGAIPEMLGDNCGLIIDSKSVEQLKNALEAILQNQNIRAKMANRSYNKVLNQYDVKIVVSQYMDIWQKLKA